MKEKELDQLIQQAIEQETELPEGLSQRLEQFVDKLPESSHAEVRLSRRKRPVLWVRYTRIAAAILVAVLFYYLPDGKEKKTKRYLLESTGGGTLCSTKADGNLTDT